LLFGIGGHIMRIHQIYLAALLGGLCATTLAGPCQCDYKNWVGSCNARIERGAEQVTITSSTQQCSRVDWNLGGQPHTTIVVDGVEQLNISGTAQLSVDDCKICKDARFAKKDKEKSPKNAAHSDADELEAALGLGSGNKNRTSEDLASQLENDVKQYETAERKRRDQEARDRVAREQREQLEREKREQYAELERNRRAKEEAVAAREAKRNTNSENSSGMNSFFGAVLNEAVKGYIKEKTRVKPPVASNNATTNNTKSPPSSTPNNSYTPDSCPNNPAPGRNGIYACSTK
jgi:hypothetical protein